MSHGEVFPNAPLVLVALEVRYPRAEHLAAETSLNVLKQMVADHLPLRGQLRREEMQIAARPGPPPTWTEHTVPRFTTRDRTIALQVDQTSLIVETTTYRGYDAFRELIALATSSLTDLGKPDGVTRIGLRYIDEVRVPGVTEPPGAWEGYISDNLLAPVSPDFVEGAHLSLRTWQGTVSYGTGRDRSLVLRYGPAEGYAVPPNGQTRRKNPEGPGLFFLLDFDSYWEPADEIPEFDSARILEVCDELHTPARALFGAVVTEKLRDEVFRQAPEEVEAR